MYSHTEYGDAEYCWVSIWLDQVQIFYKQGDARVIPASKQTFLICSELGNDISRSTGKYSSF